MEPRASDTAPRCVTRNCRASHCPFHPRGPVAFSRIHRGRSERCAPGRPTPSSVWNDNPYRAIRNVILDPSAPPK